jgi:hypothetical protein
VDPTIAEEMRETAAIDRLEHYSERKTLYWTNNVPKKSRHQKPTKRRYPHSRNKQSKEDTSIP